MDVLHDLAVAAGMDVARAVRGLAPERRDAVEERGLEGAVDRGLRLEGAGDGRRPRERRRGRASGAAAARAASQRASPSAQSNSSGA